MMHAYSCGFTEARVFIRSRLAHSYLVRWMPGWIQYRKDYKLNVRQFTYSWATNRYGTVWNIIKHPCANAFRNATGLEFNQFPAMQTFSMPTMDSLLHDTNCSGRETVVYPCADSYDGFDPKSMNLDISKSKSNPASSRLKLY